MQLLFVMSINSYEGGNLLISVKLQTFLKNYCPNNDGILQIEYEKGLTARKLLERLGLNSGIVGLVLKNGKIAHCDDDLAEGDSIELYPLFGGG